MSDNDFPGSRRRRRGGAAFSPSSLFANGEQGVWYDPSDLTPEKVSWRRNLLTYSQDFDNAAWTKSNASILSNLMLYSQDLDNAYWTKESGAITANSSTAPDGTTTADLFVPNTTAIDTHRITRVATTVGPDTFSFYAKASGYSWVKARFSGGWVNFNVSNGTVGFSSGVNSPTITSVGSGWYRCSFVFSTLGTNTFYLSVDTADTNNVNTNNYAGDGTSGILFWGVQQVPGSTAQTYTRSLATAAPIQFADPLGGTLADRLVPDTVSSQHRLDSMNVAVVGGTAYTASVYAKQDGYKYAALRLRDAVSTADAVFDLNTGTLFSTNASSWTNLSTSITNIGSGWYRITMTATAAAAGGTAGTTLFRFNIGNPTDGTLSAFAGDGINGILIYGAQVEQASTASAYQRITDFSSDFLAAFPAHALYQESTGTTPVTALGQSVGLVLDKRLGALTNLGPELVTNGTFDSSTTGWTSANSPGLNVSPSGVAITNNGATNGLLYQAIATTVGRSYLITGNILFGGGFARIETSNAIPTSVTGNMINVTASGRYQWYFTASVATTYIVIGNRNDANAFNIYDNISVREVPGNHALQATSASRPTLQARSNLLTYTEQFDNAGWTKSSSTVTANTAVAPDGASTADKVIVNNGVALGISSGAGLRQDVTKLGVALTYTQSVYAKAVEFNRLQVWMSNLTASASAYATFDLANGTVVGGSIGGTFTNKAASIESVGNGWYRCILTATTDTDTSLRNSYFPTDSVATTGNGTSGVLVWGAQIELGSTASTYQRVVTATDYADVGLPRNLTFDGVDDSLATAGNVDFATWTVGTRRNLLTVPTMFDDAAWSKIGTAAITANTTIAPDGTTTADTLAGATGNPSVTSTDTLERVVTVSSSTTYTFSIWAWAGTSTTGRLVLRDASTGTVVATDFVPSATATRYSVTLTTGAGTSQMNIRVGNANGTLIIWGAQLEVGSTATAFQDVGTDKVTLFSGVTKLSDAAAGMIVELSVNQNSNAGGFYISAAETVAGNYGTRIGGNRGYNNATFVAPITNVVSLAGDLAASGVTTGGVVARFNGIVNTAGVAGTTMPGGNFGSYLLYVGRRASTTFPFNGRLFQLVIRGAATDSVTVGNAERWVGQLTGVAL